MRRDPPDSRVWRVPAADRLRWLDGGEEAVVFHSGSGETHLLDGDAAEILRGVEAHPASPADLTARFAPSASDAERAGVQGRIEQCLREFHRLGLIESVPS
ncbi:MAG: HPr-rel-A system PqqD family peptide chaperone [Alphaproteobacteria bacterium]